MNSAATSSSLGIMWTCGRRGCNHGRRTTCQNGVLGTVATSCAAPGRAAGVSGGLRTCRCRRVRSPLGRQVPALDQALDGGVACRAFGRSFPQLAGLSLPQSAFDRRHSGRTPLLPGGADMGRAGPVHYVSAGSVEGICPEEQTSRRQDHSFVAGRRAGGDAPARGPRQGQSREKRGLRHWPAEVRLHLRPVPADNNCGCGSVYCLLK